jgi:hypothetical protein
MFANQQSIPYGESANVLNTSININSLREITSTTICKVICNHIGAFNAIWYFCGLISSLVIHPPDVGSAIVEFLRNKNH